MGCFASKEQLVSDHPGPSLGKTKSGDLPSPFSAEATKSRPSTNGNGSGVISGGNSVELPAHVLALRASNGSFSGVLGTQGSGSVRTSTTRKTPKKSFIGADLDAIVDDRGTINPLVSRQLSMMSHYSLKSESGSVIIQPEEAAVNKNNMKLIKLIGRGGFGNVYLGEWEGRRVAIKIVSGSNNAESPDEQVDHEWEARKEKMAQMEAILMSAMNHHNIVCTHKVVAYQGDAIDPDMARVEKSLVPDADQHQPPTFEWHIIMEYCDRGSLSRALAANRFHEVSEQAGYFRWDVWASLEVLKEVTQAIIFLHENRILHGDLKAANVLLTASDKDRRGFVVKVADFGLARVLNAMRTHIKTQTFGTVTHMPPELLSHGLLSPSADVYAIGVLMWEMYTAERVFKQLSDSEVILAVVTRKLRPTFPPDCPSRYRYLAERCWAEMSEARPGLQQLHNELENLQKQLAPNGPNSPKLHVQSIIKPARRVSQNTAPQPAPQQQQQVQAPPQQPAKPLSRFGATSGDPRTQNQSFTTQQQVANSRMKQVTYSNPGSRSFTYAASPLAQRSGSQSPNQVLASGPSQSSGQPSNLGRAAQSRLSTDKRSTQN